MSVTEELMIESQKNFWKNPRMNKGTSKGVSETFFERNFTKKKFGELLNRAPDNELIVEFHKEYLSECQKELLKCLQEDLLSKPRFLGKLLLKESPLKL